MRYLGIEVDDALDGLNDIGLNMVKKDKIASFEDNAKGRGFEREADHEGTHTHWL